ncbi:MAG: hypothetical protein DMG40_07235 [Acidobacteria bacterium]|nr:MAG: hypothetical protein DMG40_07235 [Acidobacteriota bacterium]
MKIARTIVAFAFVVFGSFLTVTFCGKASAQAPAGPVTAPPGTAPAAKAQEAPPLSPPRQSILGAWKLNRDESDDPEKRMEESRGSNGGGGYGGRRPGGWPGGGGYGGRRGGMGGGESEQERQKMHELPRPPTTMTFSMTGAEVDLMDDRDRKRAFMTDGRKLQKSRNDNYQEIAAKWDGNRLVTDEKSPRGGKMSRTFELSPDGRELYENLHIESSGPNNRPLDVHYVYDILAEVASCDMPGNAAVKYRLASCWVNRLIGHHTSKETVSGTVSEAVRIPLAFSGRAGNQQERSRQ